MALLDRFAHRRSSGRQHTCSVRAALPNPVVTSVLILCSAVPGVAQCNQRSDDVCVSTQHNTIYRTGAYLKEE